MRIDRRILGLILVFVTTFVVAIVVMQGPARLRSPDLPSPFTMPSTSAKAHPKRISRQKPNMGRGGPEGPGPGRVAHDVAHVGAPVPAISRERIADLRHQAVEAIESEERFAAIQELGSGGASGDVLETLDRVLQDSRDLRERLAAVQVLGRLAEAGDSDGRILRLIQIALSDQDEHVAASARDLITRSSRPMK
jgi:hypothetical protein